MTAYPSFRNFHGLSKPRRGVVSLTTSKFYNPPIDGRVGGDPYRGETDEEYAARLKEEGWEE